MITPYYDENFLLKLDKVKKKEIFARITSLSQDEYPVEYIEGRVVSGSINIDGTSTIRRTCSLSLVANELNIKDYYWGLNTKFQLEVGVKNTIDSKYPEIIWFPQGLYIFTSFNTSLSTSNYTINISGKDKMCLLNGEVSGSLPHSVNFGVISYYDKETNITTDEKIPIKQIIREALHVYGNELYHNIIINDVDDYGVELLEYRGDDSTPLFMFKSDLGYENMTMNKEMPCYIFKEGDWVNSIDGNPITIGNLDSFKCTYDNLTELTNGQSKTFTPGTKVRLSKDSDIEYTIAKITFGDTAGYRLTPLIYPDELICNIGESLTSMLDKLKAMLGDYEYFYDLEGHFIFQRTKTYLSNPWNSIVRLDNNDLYVESSAYTSALSYAFHDSYYFSQITNSPQLNNVKNDYSIWGARKTILGQEIPINMRYAIDNKPTAYTSINGDYYDSDNVDWREIIYQMGLDYLQHGQDDDFLSLIAENNYSLYPTGYTGYERYYTDILGFWRELYYLPELAWKLDENGFPKNKEPIIGAQYYVKDQDKVKFTKVEFNDIIEVITPNQTVQYYKKNKDGTIGAYGFPLRQFEEKNEYYIKSLNKDSYEKINIYAYKNDNINYYIIPDSLNYNVDTYYNYNIDNNPGLLNFWFDFIGEGSDIEKFSVAAIGARTKVINDNQITGIYFKDVPTVIFITPEEWNAMGGQPTQTGYVYIRINSSFNGFFNISAQGKSAHDEMETLIYNHTYSQDSINLTSIPIYYLQPNTRISIKDVGAGVEGEYIVSRLTIPLSYNGMMQITATKVAETIY